MLKAFSKLSPSKATGLDRISPKLLKDFARVITCSLTKIPNQCRSDRIFPYNFKIAIISRIFKSESKLECNNYWPISLLFAAAKVL